MLLPALLRRRTARAASSRKRSTAVLAASGHVSWLEPRMLCASVGTLLSNDFETVRPTSLASSVAPFSTSTTSASATYVNGAGTIDVSGTATGSTAAVLRLNSSTSGLWQVSLNTGLLATSANRFVNPVTSLDRLTLAFDASAREPRPFTVRITSYDANNNPTGALERTFVTAAANSYQRIATELSTFTSVSGAFDPLAPQVGLSFTVSSIQGWSGAASPANTPGLLQIDNISYAKPSLYVAPNGSGSTSNNGQSEAAPVSFARANTLSQPGDIILVAGGTYTSTGDLLSITKGGTPADWVTYKNTPGQVPVLRTTGWNNIRIGNGTRQNPADSTVPSVAYVDIRGFTIRGYGDDPTIAAEATTLDATGTPGSAESIQALRTIGGNSKYNSNGISIEGRYSANIPHHIRIADINILFTAGSGISVLEGDRVQIENNVVRNTSYWTTYATSGISILSANYFDTGPDYHRTIINNESSGTRTNVKWVDKNSYSDGNGIILDYNYFSPDKRYNASYGRTLVQNNVTFNNGGSGIHAFNSRHIDIVNNVAYLNGQRLNGANPGYYGQIYASTYGNFAETATFSGTTTAPTYTYTGATRTADVNIINNIIVAPNGPTDTDPRRLFSVQTQQTISQQPIHPITYNYPDQNTVTQLANPANQISYRNNVLWGSEAIPPGFTNAGNGSYYDNSGNVYADPQFVNASTDAALADFRIRSTSPALNLSTSGYSYTNNTYIRPSIRNATDPNVTVPNGITTTITAPRVGRDGTPRGNAIDAGAYEYLSLVPFIARAQVGSFIGNNQVNLAALGIVGGSAPITYTWSTSAKPTGAADAVFSNNSSTAAGATVATFNRVGTYTLAVRASTAAGTSAVVTVDVTVTAVLSGLTVTPSTASLTTNTTQQFAVAATDQFGQSMAAPAVTWAVTGTVATISTSGLLTTGATPSTFTVSATGGGFSATSTFTTTYGLGAATSLFGNSTPEFVHANDGTSYELGFKFTSSADGIITAIRYYKDSLETGTHVGRIWDVATGQVLASVTFTGETTSGWQTANLANPLAITKNTVYLVTVNTNGYYVATHYTFNTAYTNGFLTGIADGSNSLYGPVGLFPTQSYRNSNYFRDVIFQPYT